MSRLENTGKNFFFSVLATAGRAITSFASRTVFIHTIGIAYLGANSLFTNILTLLSLTELGFGTAIAFSLYRPLAENDKETIKSLMWMFKKTYRIIAAVIAILGLALIPFLDYLIKDPGVIQHIPFIYIVFLYNTVISYLFTYKTTLLVADQKSYVMTNILTVVNFLTVAIQIIIMLITKNYFIYLIIGAIINTVQWVFINRIIYKRYPLLKEKDILPLDANVRKDITTNVKAMVFHKFGDLCINQTDNVIISSIISITTVGLYNNYYMIIQIIDNLARSFFNSATASFGNLIALENEARRYEVFKRYNFLGFWVFGWTGICLFVLLNPFIELWLGKDYLIDTLTLALVLFNYYLVGMRVTIGNVKSAAGLYDQDKWVPLVQSLINLVVSIIGAIYIGLPGVFLGTVVSSLAVPCWYRPIIVYKHVFKQPVKEYFYHYGIYLLTVLSCLVLVLGIRDYVILPFVANNIVAFLLQMFACAVIPNAVIILLFKHTSEFHYFWQLGQNILGRFHK